MVNALYGWGYTDWFSGGYVRIQYVNPALKKLAGDERQFWALPIRQWRRYFLFWAVALNLPKLSNTQARGSVEIGTFRNSLNQAMTSFVQMGQDHR